MVSARRYAYGRQQMGDEDEDEDYGGGFGAYGGFSFGGYGISTSANGTYEGNHFGAFPGDQKCSLCPWHFKYTS